TDNVGVAGYRVYRNGIQVGTTTMLAYSDTGLQPQTPYTYEVRAYDAAGSVGPAATASATTPGVDTASPSVPTGLTAKVQKGRKVVLSWNASNDNVGAVGYDVFRSSVQVAGPAGTSYTDRPGRGTFSYQVRARDAAGNVSGMSTAVTVTT
ncbi:MAG: alpha-amylase, partial [Gaiellaceae bacterium]